ncbi:hypothetical protein LQ938_00150 [Microbacterium sp. cx-55]|uniref:hypothetical protein n=1 Tax=unclassified Microbacterium TaxID=2609290 RepID=UPI001CBB9E0A|nr:MULTISPECIES: hypothetical protein [unclassified Microbacterium]MBZ4487214.1 hypothetical protein [Microbacterium sp. cx-55]MCC4908668.1 hypothetical protein [Microbacterium sp. cx-59]UGB35238.1 hypothetical protein LQ938_00150 [Microbacterium sp. cx-55]
MVKRIGIALTSTLTALVLVFSVATPANAAATRSYKFDNYNTCVARMNSYASSGYIIYKRCQTTWVYPQLTKHYTLQTSARPVGAV